MNLFLKLTLISFIFYLLPNFVSANLVAKSDLLMSQHEQNNFVFFLNEAIQDHPIALEAYSLVAQSQAKLNAVKSNERPQIKFQANTRNSLEQKFEDPLSTMIESSRDRHRSDTSLIIQQSIFDKSIKKEIAKQEEIRQADLSGKQQKISQLTLQMTLSCQNTAVFHMIRNLTEDSIRSHREISERIRMRVESGRAASPELSRANARLAEAEAKKMTVDLNLSTAIAEFNQLFPNSPPCIKLFSINTDYLILNPDILLVEMQNNFSLQQANSLIKAAKQELERAKAGLIPKISAELRGDRYDLSGDRNYDIYAGVNFNFDLYTGGRRSSMIQIAKEQLNAAIFKRDALLKELTAQVEANFAELNNSKTRINAFESAYDAYTDSRNKLKLQFESANVSLLELLQAERDHLESAELLLINHKSILSARLKQLFLLGQLNNYLNSWITNHSLDNGDSLE